MKFVILEKGFLTSKMGTIFPSVTVVGFFILVKIGQHSWLVHIFLWLKNSTFSCDITQGQGI